MNRPAIGIGIFVQKNGKLLMGKRASTHGTGAWSAPGGYLEYGESFEQCAARETLEETGIKIKNIGLITTVNNFFPEEKKHTITIWMKAEWESGEPKTVEHDKFIEVGWFNVGNLPKPLFVPLKLLKKAKPELFR